jgi:hypothetical protein
MADEQTTPDANKLVEHAEALLKEARSMMSQGDEKALADESGQTPDTQAPVIQVVQAGVIGEDALRRAEAVFGGSDADTPEADNYPSAERSGLLA